MKINISIETHESLSVVSNMFDDTKTFESGMSMKAPGGFGVTYESESMARALDIPSTLQFVVDTAQTVEVGLFTTWLYEKVKEPKKAKIIIKEKEIEFDKNEIQKLLERTIEIEE